MKSIPYKSTFKENVARIMENLSNKLIEQYSAEYHKIYGTEPEFWYNMNRFQMLKKFIEKNGSLVHPLWDEFTFYKLEELSKIDPKIAETYFKPIDCTTRFHFSVWLFTESDLNSEKLLKNKEVFNDYNLYYEDFEGKMLTIITDKEDKIQKVFKDIIVCGWDCPRELFIDNIALCYTIDSSRKYLYGLINYNGEFIKEPQYTDINEYMIDNNIFQFCENSKYGYMNLKGEVVLPAIYENISGDSIRDQDYGLNCLFCKIDDKMGLMDFSLNELLPCIYKDILVLDLSHEQDKDQFIVKAETFKNKVEVYHFVSEKLVRK